MFRDNGAGIKEQLQQEAEEYVRSIIKHYIPAWFCFVCQPGEDSFPFYDDQLVQKLYRMTGSQMPESDSQEGWRLIIQVSSYAHAKVSIVLDPVTLESSVPLPIKLEERGPYRLKVPVEFDRNVHLTAECKRAIRAVLGEYDLLGDV